MSTNPNAVVEQSTWESIAAAHTRIAPRIHRTPVLRSATLDAMCGAELFFKCENLQKTGSFKIRGATNAIFSLANSEAARGIVTPSSGNHGAAVACAAGWRGIPAWIVMPKNAPAVKCRAVEAYGGKITFCEPRISARNEAAARIQAETGAMLIHPYDDDRIIAGQATAAKEFLEEIAALDALLTPVSGGGLLSGSALSAKHIRPEIRVYGCEPARADDAYQSLQTGTLHSMESSDTIADGLRASLAARTFAILQKHLSGIFLVSEEEIISAMALIWERLKVITEPSSAIALAPLLKREVIDSISRDAPRARRLRIGIILSGGNVDLRSLPFH
ncbi:MAG TPA: pyridoxal-phosphate dependent enzyme [Candidatus Acidoferrum sp.]|nr:pyridoxal-phosphate dependent enzyme [Candidatus Acidoferrum sp.]